MLRPARVVAVLAAALVLGGTTTVRAQAPAFAVFDAAARHLTVAYVGPADVALAWLLPDARATLEGRCGTAPDCPPDEAFAVLEALLAATGDPHTRVLPPEAFARLLEANAGGSLRAGVGLRVRAPSHGLGLVVVDVAFGTPAEAAGLMRGDRVVAVNGAWLPALVGDRRAAWEAAVADAPVVLRVVRSGLGTFEARLEAVPVPVDRPPRLSWLDGGIAWVQVPSLLPADAVAPAVHRLLEEADASGAVGLLLDLRDDDGGAYGACLTVAGAFVDAVERVFLGPAACLGLRYQGGVLDTYDPLGTAHAYEVVRGAVRWSGPVVVLVNARTSSAAEALAYELQRAGVPVVGEATAGMANAAVALVALPEGYGLVLTVALAVDADGVALPNRVVPDVLVHDDLWALADGEDRVLEAGRRRLVGAR